MTSSHADTELSTGTDYDALASRFRPIFDRIAAGTAERERRRELPHEAIGRLKAAGFGGNDEAEHAANVAAEIESAQSQLVVSERVLRAATRLFDALGASATRSTTALDRHWRNARTVSSHNPLVYKARIVGDWVINGRTPPFVWRVGAGTSPSTETGAVQ